MKTLPLQQWAVRRAFLKQLKQAFDEAGIEIPFPHVTVYAGQPKAGDTPPFTFQERAGGDGQTPREAMAVADATDSGAQAR